MICSKHFATECTVDFTWCFFYLFVFDTITDTCFASSLDITALCTLSRMLHFDIIKMSLESRIHQVMEERHVDCNHFCHCY